MLAYEFQVTLPIVAGRVFHGNSEDYGLMMASMGIGAVIGGLWTASKGKTGTRAITRAVASLRSVHYHCGSRTKTRHRIRRARARRLRERLVPVHDQLDAATGDRSADARARDGALGRCLHGIDADWGTAHRLDHE